MISFLFIFLFFPLSSSLQFELSFVISGSDEFGGHASQRFETNIIETIRYILGNSRQFDGTDSNQFSIVWAHVDGKWTVLSPLSINQDKLLEDLIKYLDTKPSTELSASAGISGSVQFCLENVFSPVAANVPKIIIALLHEEILAEEISEIFDNQKEYRRQVLLFMIVFPWSQVGCSEASKTIKNIQNYKAEGVFCANKPEQLTQIPQIIQDNLLKYKRIIEYMKTRNVTQRPIVKITFKTNYMGGEGGGKTAEENDLDTCTDVYCEWWFILLMVLLIIALIGTTPLIVQNIMQFKRRPRDTHITIQAHMTSAQPRNSTASNKRLSALADCRPPDAQMLIVSVEVPTGSQPSTTTQKQSSCKENKEDTRSRRKSAPQPQNRRISAQTKTSKHSGAAAAKRLGIPEASLRKISSAIDLPADVTDGSPSESTRSSHSSIHSSRQANWIRSSESSLQSSTPKLDESGSGSRKNSCQKYKSRKSLGGKLMTGQMAQKFDKKSSKQRFRRSQTADANACTSNDILAVPSQERRSSIASDTPSKQKTLNLL